MKQLIEIEVDIPDGFRFVRYGTPKAGETSLDREGETYTWVHDAEYDRIIIERDTPPIKYREPDLRDVGKPCEACDDAQAMWFDVFSYVGRTLDGMFVVEDLDESGVVCFCHARVIDDTPSEPQYRDATEADIGRKDVQFSDNGIDWTDDTKLVSIRPTKIHNYGGNLFNWKFARVRIS